MHSLCAVKIGYHYANIKMRSHFYQKYFEEIGSSSPHPGMENPTSRILISLPSASSKIIVCTDRKITSRAFKHHAADHLVQVLLINMTGRAHTMLLLASETIITTVALKILPLGFLVRASTLTKHRLIA